MAYRILADLVVGLHFTFILFVALGGLLVLRWPRASWVHLPCAGWGAVVALMGWVCPLTPLESRLRAAAGEAPSPAPFIERYLLPLIYPGTLTREIQIGLGIGVIVLNAAIYAAAWRKWRR